MKKGNEAQRLIKLIHVARRDLSMEDDNYRAIVSRITNTRTSSSKDCTVLELERIVSHLKKAGFKVRKPKTAQPKETRQLATGGEVSKVRALWLLLHEIGAVKNPSESALNAYVKRVTDIDDLSWLDGNQLTALIETLKKWAVRVFPAKINEMLTQAKAKGFIEHDANLSEIMVFYAPTLGKNTYSALLKTYKGLSTRLTQQADIPQ